MAPSGPQHDAGDTAEVTAHVTELEAQVARLREVLPARAQVDQAIGVICAVGGLSPDEAWDALREISMCSNTKLGTTARQLVTWAHHGELAEDIRAQLERQIARREPKREPEPVTRP